MINTRNPGENQAVAWSISNIRADSTLVFSVISPEKLITF